MPIIGTKQGTFIGAGGPGGIGPGTGIGPGISTGGGAYNVQGRYVGHGRGMYGYGGPRFSDYRIGGGISDNLRDPDPNGIEIDPGMRKRLGQWYENPGMSKGYVTGGTTLPDEQIKRMSDAALYWRRHSIPTRRPPMPAPQGNDFTTDPYMYRKRLLAALLPIDAPM